MNLSRYPVSTRFRGPARAACVLLASVAPLAHAADTCFVAADPVAFGVYDTSSSSPTPGAGRITVDCQGNKEVAVTIQLTAGNGSYAARRMASTLDALQYNLYLDTGYTRIFGNGTSGSEAAVCTTGISANGCTGSNPTGSSKRAVLPFYGRIPAQQNVASGDYSDDIQVTISF